MSPPPLFGLTSLLTLIFIHAVGFLIVHSFYYYSIIWICQRLFIHLLVVEHIWMISGIWLLQIQLHLYTILCCV